MPAEDCPSFHWRPSTARTFVLPSASTRQTRTTLKNDFGSAPTVSLEMSALTDNLLRYGESIIDLDAEIPDGALDLRVAEQKLDGSQISGAPVDQRRLGSTQ